MSSSFDKRLAELDAYLQMLIIESESLDSKLNNISSSTTSLNCDSERDGLMSIKNNLETLLGSIKHSIVLLQIAKVSLRTPNSSMNSESPSSSTTTPPSRPARSSKPSTPVLSERKLKSQNRNQSRKLDGASQRVVSLEYGSPSQLHNSRERQFLYSSQKSATTTATLEAVTTTTPKSVMNAKGAHNFRSELNAKTADECSACEGVNTAHQTKVASDAAGEELKADSLRRHDSRLSRDADSIAGKSNDCGDDDDDDDDDDAFFDADDEQHTKSTTFPAYTATPTSEVRNNNNIISRDSSSSDYNSVATTNAPGLVNEINSCKNQQATTMPPNSETNNYIDNNGEPISDGSIDWDALYEDEDEEDLGSLEGQGSVIKHLLSQIRIGMDLTKVVLPTFILERRSLLEMYADFFAHPDLFSAIPEYETPEERMIQVVRWYLSAFHAGRKSSVAKKPYNPILGEIFKCQWELKENIDETGRSKKVNSVSDADNAGQRLTFIAEQVSHHPPVSAFYAENKQKSISCCAHIYTKSKYLGLSVGVHNVGQGVINLIDRKESYICTFPSAYGRSILTVPWVELGGPVTIVCNETGYKANIEFVMKPFYGGKKHRVLGEILRPTNEPFLTIDGEWNGIMFSKCPPNSANKQVFVDTKNLPVIKKQVNPVSTQDSFESRNVWKEVTRALKLQDINTATASKSFIEQRQRNLLKERLEKGVKWKTRYFEASDDGWVYSSPLSISDSSNVECESNHQ